MKLENRFFGGLTAVTLMAFASGASAQVVASDAGAVMAAMQEFGFIASMGQDNGGDPKISSRVSDTKFKVYFFGCNDQNLNCTSIQFGAGYDLTNGMNASKINEWNRGKRFAKAYIDDEGDPFLEMDINLDFEGVGPQNFEDSMDLWRILVEDFEEFIDW
jgi:hypothetical protein